MNNLETPPSAADVQRGLVYVHNRANANTAELHRACATLQAIGDLLIERGILDRADVEARRQEASEQLRRQYVDQGMAVAMQEFGASKYNFRHASEVDCAGRIHLCHAACCRLPLALSREDVQEGVIQWELSRPYLIAHAADGYCVHMDRETRHCAVYDHRPIPCRGYDCRNDKRIWLDFDNCEINPQIHDPAWPLGMEA